MGLQFICETNLIGFLFSRLPTVIAVSIAEAYAYWPLSAVLPSRLVSISAGVSACRLIAPWVRLGTGCF
jgi:hypothetical protein